ncbi:hypothetical protein [Nocardia rhizosphaerihabitans]|uniref:hypothetical protein n=1 Tax=Nocardia rhizosphaerihabitans TaxID=1691570 RepID=UPI00166DBF6F|nr:hypothetical protein [Nocardia rhizosphaerihabitans]
MASWAQAKPGRAQGRAGRAQAKPGQAQGRAGRATSPAGGRVLLRPRRRLLGLARW